MNFGVRLEIDFHQQDEASIFLENSAAEENAKFAELLTFCLIAVRMMFNLNCGGDPGGSARSLAFLLAKAREELLPVISSFTPNAVRLIPYPGSPGRKRFIGRLTFTEARLDFRMDVKGFGLLGRGVGYYAPHAVILLLEYLGKKRLNDKKYIDSLLGAAVECGEAFLTNRINLTSQHVVANQIAACAAASLIESDPLAPLRQRAEQGNADAQLELANKYCLGEKLPQDFKEAAKWARMAAERGLLDAQFLLAELYRQGLGVPQDHSKALELYLDAANKGHMASQINLGTMYSHGEGVDKDLAKALQWMSLAAEQGSAWAQTNLGIMHQKDLQDYQEAAKWFMKAAEQGDPFAQNALGTMCEKGEGLQQDYSAAAMWYRKAAEQGYSNAQYNLGVLYSNFKGLVPDYAEAFKWFLRAAEQGLVDAQLMVAIFYEKVIKEPEKAKEWYQKAADQGHKGAAKALRELP